MQHILRYGEASSLEGSPSTATEVAFEKFCQARFLVALIRVLLSAGAELADGDRHLVRRLRASVVASRARLFHCFKEEALAVFFRHELKPFALILPCNMNVTECSPTVTTG